MHKQPFIHTTDTLIIGCGIAGATAALKISEDATHQITVLTRAIQADDSNSSWAQGGIVTRGLDDTPELLIKDILHAGAGLSSPQAAKILAEEGPTLVRDTLINQCGVQFDKHESGDLVYGLEGAHSRRRVVHVGDKTGLAIMKQLLAEMMSRPNIQLLTEHTAIDLLTHGSACIGASVLHRDSGQIIYIHAPQTILATGGIGQLYANTSNPAGARGDGIAMAQRAGATISNAEYVQFHPTVMAVDVHPQPLVSEAIRGEGAILRTPDGQLFMHNYSPEWKDLAPRDVVARAIFNEMQMHDYPYVYLDIASQRDPEFIRERFPTLIENCATIGIDPTVDPIPVTPGAHYFCGGVDVDEHGRTSMLGLFAIGEVSNTGLHGANRLASTSLLEGLVWGYQTASYIRKNPRRLPFHLPHPKKPEPQAHTVIQTYPIDVLFNHLRDIMWKHVGIERTECSLMTAIQQLENLQITVDMCFDTIRTTDAMIGLRNAVQTSLIVANAALANPESIGSHFRADAVELQSSHYQTTAKETA